MKTHHLSTCLTPKIQITRNTREVLVLLRLAVSKTRAKKDRRWLAFQGIRVLTKVSRSKSSSIRDPLHKRADFETRDSKFHFEFPAQSAFIVCCDDARSLGPNAIVLLQTDSATGSQLADFDFCCSVVVEDQAWEAARSG